MAQQNIKQVKGATQGSVLFLGQNGVVSENNGKLFWDITNNRLGIGTPTPSYTLHVSGNSYLNGDLTVTGSFSVLGTSSTINSINLTVQDPIILLASTQSGSPLLDSGLFINRGTGATQAFIWDESADEFSFIQTNDSASAIGNVNISSYSNIRAGGATLSQLYVIGGSTNSTDRSVVISNSAGQEWFNVYNNRKLLINGGSNDSEWYGFGQPVAGSGNSNVFSIYAPIGGGIGRLLLAANDGTGNDGSRSISLMDGGFAVRYIFSTNRSQVTLNSSTINNFQLFSNNSGANREHVGFVNGVGGGYYLDQDASSYFRMYMIGVTGSPTNHLLSSDGDSWLAYTGTMKVGIGTSTPTTKLHIFATQSGGAFRLVDTTQAAGYILVSDANGVGTWTASSNLVSDPTVDNGLTYSSGNIGLGGELSRPTIIQNNGNAFTMSTTNNIEFNKNLGGITYSYRLDASGTGLKAVTPTSENLIIVGDSSSVLEVRKGFSYSHIKVFNYDQTSGDGSDLSTNNRMLIRDDIYFKGIMYYGDYTANFTNNSLVTKAYVDNLLNSSTSKAVDIRTFTASLPQILTHNLDTNSVIIQNYDSTGVQIIADTVTVLGTGSVSIEFSQTLTNVKTVIIG